MLAGDVDDAFHAHGQDVEPEQDRPETVLFAHMVRAGAGTFLAADRHAAVIHQIAEEFPAGRGFVHADAELFGHAVGGGTGRHGAGDAGKSLGIAGRKAGIGGKHREAIGWRDEDALADDQVAIAVAIGSGAEIRCVVAHHFLVKRAGHGRGWGPGDGRRNRAAA